MITNTRFVGGVALLQVVAYSHAQGLPLNRAPIVMSHNAATGYLVATDDVTGPFKYGYVKNQRASFSEQLDCGARALDLEFRRNAAVGEIRFFHEDFEISEITVPAGFDEIKAWSDEHEGDEFVLLSMDTLAGCEDCLPELSSLLSPLGITLISDCSAFQSLTVQGALDLYGNILAASKACFVQNYDATLSCHGFFESSIPDNVQAVRDCVSADSPANVSFGSVTKTFNCLGDKLTPTKVDVFDCWAGSNTAEVPMDRLLFFLNETARNVGAPDSGLPWQWQGLFQGNDDGILLGLYRPIPLPSTLFGLEPSSLLIDAEKSLVNQRVLSLVSELVQEGVTLNLVEVDDVCDAYASQLRGVLMGETPATGMPSITTTKPTSTVPPFVVINYEEVGATRSFHEIPRFGHTDQVSEAFGSEDDRNEYVKGLLFVGAFVLAVFLAWLILLLIFEMLGGKVVGFLSGRAFQVPQESRKPKIIRIIFILSAVILLVFSILLVTEGITELESSIDTVYDGTAEVNTLLTETNANVITLDETGTSAVLLRDEVVAALQDDFCPDGDLTGETGTDFDALSQQVVTFLNDLGDFTEEGVNDLRKSMKTAVSSANDVESTADDLKVKNDCFSLIFIIPLPVFCVTLVGAAVLAWFDRSQKWVSWLVSWVILPLFVLWVVVCCILAGLSAVAASANADFCSGGEDKTPESSVQAIMRINDVDQSDLLYKTVQYYIHQCAGFEDPLEFLYGYVDELERAHSEVTKLEKAINDTTVEEIIRICGDQKYYEIANLVSEMKDQTTTLVTTAGETEDLLVCAKYAPIYTNTIYNGTCSVSVKGFAWMFASFFIIGFFGLIMITLRSALRPTEYITEDLSKNAPPMESYEQEQPVARKEEEGVRSYEQEQPLSRIEEEGDKSYPQSLPREEEEAMVTVGRTGIEENLEEVEIESDSGSRDNTEEIRPVEGENDDRNRSANDGGDAVIYV